MSGAFSISTFKLKLAIVVLLGIGILVTSGAIAHAQETDPITALSEKLDNFVLIVAAALVFFMQAGFAFLGAGLIRSKNTVNYMTKSFLDFCIASLGFWAFGYALMMGGGGAAGIIGSEGFFLADFSDADLVSWLFQMVFAGTAATIIAGAMAERTNINAYFAYSFIVGAVVYPIYGHWAWNGVGSLAALRVAAYAGSGVGPRVGGCLAPAGDGVARRREISRGAGVGGRQPVGIEWCCAWRRCRTSGSRGPRTPGSTPAPTRGAG